LKASTGYHHDDPVNVLFIGGTGNISAECAAHLRRQGHDIMVLTRGRTPIPAEYQAIRADRASLESMRTALDGVNPDVVINFLGYELRDVEIDHALFQGQVHQYIFISSTTVYSRPARLPMTEDAPQANPWWEYARKKTACEDWLLKKHREEGFPLTIVRPSHTYSQLWVPNAISSSSYSVAARLEQGKPLFMPDDGSNPWTLTASSDFAVGLGGLVGNASAIGEAFHITSDEVLTWKEIYATISEEAGNSSPELVPIPVDFICQVDPQLTGTLKGDKAHPGIFDNSKIKRFVPGFGCKKPFRTGVRESIAWLRAHPDRQNRNASLEARIESVLQSWARVKN
jgi:nucleoside-diphosphate-sugar epimerase